MASSSRDLTQPDLCLRDSSGGHVHNSGEQGDPNLRFTLPGQQGFGGRRPLHTLGLFRADLWFPFSSHSSQNSGLDQVLPRHDSDSHSLPTPVLTLASTSTTAQSMSLYSVTRSRIIPVHRQPTQASILSRSQTVESGHVAIMWECLRQHPFPESVV